MFEELERRSAVGCELVAEVVRSFGEVRLRVNGCSMMPAIWPGDVLIVRRCGVVELQLGQIALCRRKGELVAHRIASIRDNAIITRGDTLLVDDPPTSECDLVGRVVRVLRNGRPVDPGQSLAKRLSSTILRHSDFWLRVTLRVSRILTRSGDKYFSWES
jgi:signal peptidase I